MRTVVITGAGGFIGSRLVAHIIHRKKWGGGKVFGIDIAKNKMSIFDSFQNFIPIEADFSKYADLPKYIDNADVFYHLAWMGYGKDTNSFDIQIQNVKGAYEAANAAAKIGCKKIVFACSSHEYQKNLSHGKDGVCSIYGASKSAAKAYMKVVAHNNGMDFNGAIFTNVFGVGDRSKRTANFFIHKLLNGEDLDLITGDRLYDWTYIDDVVDALTVIGEKGVDGKEYYVGSRALRPFKEIITDVRDILSSSSQLNFGAYNDTTYIDYTGINTYELYEDTGYLAHCDFKESILKTAEWVKDLKW